MKVVCINNTSRNTYSKGDKFLAKELTINKIYDVVFMFNGYIPNDINSEYYIKNDIGHHNYYKRYLFLSLDEYRNSKLDKILA